MTTGERIRQARKNRNLTQKKLGGLCGMADSAIRRYESGRGNPTIATLQRIAGALGVPLSDLLDPAAQSAFQAGIDLGSDMEEWSNSIIEGLRKQDGYTFSESETRLISAFSKLTEEGQTQTIKYAEDLAGNPRFQRPIEPAEEYEEEIITLDELVLNKKEPPQD